MVYIFLMTGNFENDLILIHAHKFVHRGSRGGGGGGGGGSGPRSKITNGFLSTNSGTDHPRKAIGPLVSIASRGRSARPSVKCIDDQKICCQYPPTPDGIFWIRPCCVKLISP